MICIIKLYRSLLPHWYMYNTILWHSVWKIYCNFCCMPKLVGVGTMSFWRQQSMAVFSPLCLLPQISLNCLANRRRHLLFVNFSEILNLADLVNHWKPTSWILKVLLIDSNNPILIMIGERKGHKPLIFLCLCKNCGNSSLVSSGPHS